MAPTPFKIAVPQDKIDKLKLKLSLAEFPTETEGVGWDRGVPLSEVQRLAKKWELFDWRATEAEINKIPQFTTGIEVDGFGTLDIHFVHQRSSSPNAIPLIFVHGWPGSFLEVAKILPLLSDAQRGDGPAFDIVAPSIPNYGFSDGVTKPGFGTAQSAEALHKLMLQLGYEQYVTQGGDVGFGVTRAMAVLYPGHVKAGHVNMLPVSPPAWTKNPLLALQHAVSPYTEKEKAGFDRSKWFSIEGRGYYLEQATKPQTLSYALTDSPVALLAWIYEKLHDWSDNYPWTDDEILTFVSIYAFSRAGPGAAHRGYYENNHRQLAKDLGLKVVWQEQTHGYIPIKTGLAYNPKELMVSPKTWTRALGDIVYEADNESGGHFYAHERPEWLARDLKTMFGKNGGAYGVVKGREGY